MKNHNISNSFQKELKENDLYMARDANNRNVTYLTSLKEKGPQSFVLARFNETGVTLIAYGLNVALSPEKEEPLKEQLDEFLEKYSTGIGDPAFYPDSTNLEVVLASASF